MEGNDLPSSSLVVSTIVDVDNDAAAVVSDEDGPNKDNNPDTVENDSDVGSEEEEVLIEPRFKYCRVLGDLCKILESDGASCIAVHDKFIAIGCRSGRICLFDHLGNAHMESTARHHKCAVTGISIDGSGRYFASCANDFSVSLFGIGCDEYNQRITLQVSVRAIAIAEDFSRQGSGQKFATGERDLVIHERSFLGRRKSAVIYQGLDKDGYISAISWRDSYIAFTNESGTRIYDIKASKTITLVQPLHKVEKYYSSKFQPRHFWLNASTIAIGWANTICICEIHLKSDKNSFKQGRIIYRWVIPDFFIGGLSSTPWLTDDADDDNVSFAAAQSDNDKADVSHSKGCDSDQQLQTVWREIVVFGIKIEEVDAEKSLLDNSKSIISDSSQATTATTTMVNLAENQQCFAQLVLLQPVNVDEFQLTSEDTIEMRYIDPKNLNRFAMASLPHDNLYFLLGPKELIEAHPCSVDNRISWYIENELYFNAIDCALKYRDSLQETSVIEVGRHLISYLMDSGEYDTAIKYLPQICGRQKDEWEYYVGKFEKARQILKLSPIIPVNEPQLEPECYESILTVALYTCTNLFKALIFQWNTDLYRVGFIRDKAIARLAEKGVLNEEDQINIFKVLAHLYVYERDFKRAIDIYLLLHDPSVFGVIDRHNLFTMVQDQVVELMEINMDLTIRLLLDNESALPANSVVTLLSNHPKLQIAYLNKLHNRGEGAEFSDLTVRLYAEHDRPKLLPFLRKSEHYKLDKALDVCKRQNLVEEKIFLLGRLGNRLQALEEIINNLGRIEMAIEFCKEHSDDVELWDRLIELAMKSPSHVSALLAASGTFIDNPLSIIEKIPVNMRIEGLKGLLLKVMRDSEAQLNLLKDSLSVGAFDVTELFKVRVKPFVGSIDFDDICTVCGCHILERGIDANGNGGTDSIPLKENNAMELRIFFCGHKLHTKCLENKLASLSSGTSKDGKGLALHSQFSQDYNDDNSDLVDVCPLCFEHQAVKSAVSSGRRRAVTLAAQVQHVASPLATSMPINSSFDKFMDKENRNKNPFFYS